jgi:hypothetical protein
MDTVPHADLAARCRDARTPDRNLEGEIFRTLEAKEGDNWSDNFGDDDVWHREDPIGDGGWDSPPHYMSSIDAADGARGTDLRLVSLREHEASDIGAADPTWRPCGASVSDGLRTHEGRGFTLATAYMDAILTARAPA